MGKRRVISNKRQLVSKLKKEEGERLTSPTIKHLGVYHTTFPKLPIKKMEREDPLGIQEVLADCEKQSHLLLGKPDCNRRNPLHSTATESEPPQPGNEYRFLGNILGADKSAIRITTHPDMV